MNAIARVSLVAAGCLLLPALGLADTTVNGSADIYAAGTQSTLATNDTSGQSGTAPGYIAVAGGTYLTFTVTGTVGISPGDSNDADGVGALPVTSSETGYGSISGLTAPGGGYLTGVFIAGGGPTGAMPAALVYTTTDGSSYSPGLDQAFFIGDGLTGDGSGSMQEFYVPDGATELFLGISDACGFNGSPSCYLDNFGSYSVSYTATPVTPTSPSATPEPSSLALLGTSVLGAAGALRRRFRAAR